MSKANLIEKGMRRQTYFDEHILLITRHMQSWLITSILRKRKYEEHNQTFPTETKDLMDGWMDG